METIILRNGRTIKGIVKEQGFNGLFWCGQYIDKDDVKHFVTFHNNCWME